MRVRSVLLLSLVGCTPPAPARTPPTLSIEPTSGELVDVGATEVEVGKTCWLRTDDYASTGQRWELMLGDTGRRWGTLAPERGGRAEVALEGERMDSVTYRFVGGGLALSGLAATDVVSVHSKTPVWFAAVILADPRSSLDWRSADEASVRLRIVVGDDLDPRDHRRTIDCDALTLDPPKLDVTDVVDTADMQTWLVDGGDPVPIYATPDRAEAVLVLHADDGDFLQGGRLEGERRRVLLERNDYAVVGWVPANRLRLPTGGLGFGSGGGTGLGLLGRQPKRQRRDHACAERIALHVAQHEEREVVGHLEPQRPFWVDDLEPSENGWRRMHFDDDPVELRDEATWVIDEAMLARCKAI